MATAWFHVPQISLGPLTLPPEEARHALGSRRLRAGEPVVVFDGRGRVGQGVLSDEDARVTDARRTRRCAADSATVVVETVLDVPPPWPALTLIVAACKGDRLDWLLEKGTELGVARFVFAEFERGVVRAGPQHVERLRRRAIEACKQAQRAWLPEIAAGVSLSEAVTAAPMGGLLVADLAPGLRPLGDYLAMRQEGVLKAVIGPEGGLTETESVLLEARGAVAISLGTLVLRVETAALSVAAHCAAWGAKKAGEV